MTVDDSAMTTGASPPVAITAVTDPRNNVTQTKYDDFGRPTQTINALYGMIRRRLEIFVNLPHASLDRMALKKRLDELGDSARAPS